MESGVDPWDEITVLLPVFQRRVSLVLLVALLASCDEKQQATNPIGPETDSPRKTRTERASREAAGISAALRNDLATAKKRLSLDERDKNLGELAWKALASDPEIAAEALLEISSGTEEKKALIEAYIQMLLDQDKTEEAAEWAASLGNDVDTQIAHTKIAESSALSNPEQDALQLSQSSFEGEVDPQAEQVIRNWAMKNPTQAADWLRKMPGDDARANGFKILLGSWVVKDSPTAFSWVSNQTNPELRREAIAGMIGYLGGLPTPVRENLLEAAGEPVRNEIRQRIAEIYPPDESEGKSATENVPEPEMQSPSEPDSGSESAPDEMEER